MPNDNDFMQHAINLAKYAASQNEVPVGAILVQDNQIIGEGWNQPITSNDSTAHAEIIALREAAKKLNNYRLINTTLYVTLEPCLMCVGAMIHARIKRLVFGAYDPKSGAVKFLDSKKLNHSITYQGGVMENECSELLTTFFQKRRI
jgi:tRNA(adenine34) deaminase